MGIMRFNQDRGFEEMRALPRDSLTKGLNILPKDANSSEVTLAEPLGYPH
jgi:hypothetical protein